MFLREAARGALSRFKTLEAAREALDGDESALPDLWPTACEAGWPGLLIDEDHGGAGLDAFDAMLVLGECGRVLAERRAARPPARDRDPRRRSGVAAELLPRSGQRRAARGLPARAAARRPRRRLERRPPPRSRAPAARRAPEPPTGMGDVRLQRQLRVRARRSRRRACWWASPCRTAGPSAWRSQADAAGVAVEAVTRYDATRSLGHVTLEDAPATVLDAPEESLAGAWHLAQALIAAESLGSVETALDVSVAYAKERFTFGRAIGSYQAIKHSLTEVLRQLENGRSLLYYAGWARIGAPAEFPLAANAARSVGRSRARSGRAHDDLRARRHRRHMGARCAAVLPPRRSSPGACSAAPRTRPTASPAS